MKDNEDENQQIGGMDTNLRIESNAPQQQALVIRKQKQLCLMIVMTICMNIILCVFYLEQVLVLKEDSLILSVIGSILLMILDVFKLLCKNLKLLVALNLFCYVLIIFGFYISQLNQIFGTPIWICQIVQILIFPLVLKPDKRIHNVKQVEQIDQAVQVEQIEIQPINEYEQPLNPPGRACNRNPTFHQIANKVLDQVREIKKEILKLNCTNFGDPISDFDRTKYAKLMSYQVSEFPLSQEQDEQIQDESILQQIKDNPIMKTLHQHSQKIKELKLELSDKQKKLNKLDQEISRQEIENNDFKSTQEQLRTKSNRQSELIKELKQKNQEILKENEAYTKAIQNLLELNQDHQDTTKKLQNILGVKIAQNNQLKKDIQLRDEEIKQKEIVIKALQETIEQRDYEYKLMLEDKKKMATILNVQLPNDEENIQFLIKYKLQRTFTEKNESDIQNLIKFITQQQVEKCRLQRELRKVEIQNNQQDK